MSVVERRVERRVCLLGVVLGLSLVTVACTGSGMEPASVAASSTTVVPLDPSTSSSTPTSTPSTPTSTSTSTPAAEQVTSTGPDPSNDSLAAVTGRSKLDGAIASGDLCEVNELLGQMVVTSDDGLEVASEMRQAADAATAARGIVPESLRDAWDVVVSSTRRYAAALVAAGGDSSVPDVRAIQSDRAFERASSRVGAWISDHCVDDGN